MAANATAPLLPVMTRRARVRTVLLDIRPTWARSAAYRAARATVVMPGLFAISIYVVGNLQMATFAAFGSFATLVLASFSGSWQEKLTAHGLFAVAGSVLLVIGTAVHATIWLAAVVTLVVGFVVLFTGATGPNAASGATAVLLAYVLPAASPGTIGEVPWRLAGWWLASAAGTLAVLALATPPMANRLRGAAAKSADALAAELRAALEGRHRQTDADASMSAKHNLMQAVTNVPYRPTGLAFADQALAKLVEGLEWCTSLVLDLVKENDELATAPEIDRHLITQSAGVFTDSAALLRGEPARPQLEELREEEQRARLEALCNDGNDDKALHLAFNTWTVAAAAREIAADSLIATGQADRALQLAESREWEDIPESATVASDRFPPALRRLVRGNTSLRSVWFLNSARGALALAAAVAVADLTNVQHGFWVVLGTLSVLRTSAAATGATALRALAGTVLGLFIGAGLLLLIGGHGSVLWAVLPVAVFVAAYSPGTAPFAIGQAAFTVTLTVLYNLLVPVGWKVGVVRLEDIAIGAGVSALAGILFWPRGASAVVASDLADAFYQGGIYLVQATAWTLGLRETRPEAAAVVRAGSRVDDALRAFVTEQGTKRVPKEHLWRLVGGVTRLRLTASSLTRLKQDDPALNAGGRQLVEEAARIAGLYDDLAAHLARTPVTVARELATLVDDFAPATPLRGFALWVHLHLDHVRRNLDELFEPASEVAARRTRPWWR